MNELIMPEGVADNGIRELSLDEAETISGGNNTRGAPRRPARGGGGWRGAVYVAAERAVNYVWDRWGGAILGAVDSYYTGPAHAAGGRIRDRYEARGLGW